MSKAGESESQSKANEHLSIRLKEDWEEGIQQIRSLVSDNF